MGILTHLIGNLLRPARTEAYPLAPARPAPTVRGRIAVDAALCVGCSTCAQVCVSDAIHLEAEEAGIRLIVWHARCTFCGLCEFYCPTKAIRQTSDWNLAHDNAHKYQMTEDIVAAYQRCVDCDARLMVPTEGVLAASAIGHARDRKLQGPRCEACRRKLQARQLMGLPL